MKKSAIIFAVLFLSFIYTAQHSFAQEEDITFGNRCFDLKISTQNPSVYKYFTNDETEENFHEMILLQNFPEQVDPIEATANFGHQIQEQNPGAAVLIYPNLGMIEFIDFPESRDYYEYNALQYTKSPKEGIDLYQYKKRFYTCENDCSETARKSAIDFAQKTSSKTMEFVNEITGKYKID